MRRRATWHFAAALWLGLLAPLAPLAPLAAQTVLHDDRGAVLRFDAPPTRIVSLLPSLTESVCALGGCGRLVGIDRYSNWPPSVSGLPRLGGLDDAQIERIVALKPELVLAAKSARVIDRLEGLGLKVMVLESDSHADVQRTLVLLAQVLDAPEQAARVWGEIQQQVADAAARVPPRQHGRRVYFEIDPTPFAAGPASFIGQTLQGLAMANAVPAELGAFPRLNPEFVVRAQPDIVMAARQELRDMAGRPGWAGLRALQQHQTCAFDAQDYDLLIRPGPRLGLGALLLADCLAALPPR